MGTLKINGIKSFSSFLFFINYVGRIQILISMQTGIIKFFNESKGYGFVLEDGTQKEYFVHVSGLKGPVTKDDKVSFEVTEGKKGLNAVGVTKI
jgi:CspA family cold shock protein